MGVNILKLKCSKSRWFYMYHLIEHNKTLHFDHEYMCVLI
jgi:hypothetical protein